jgi:WD40 repeat protein
LSGKRIAKFSNVTSISFDQKGEFLAIGYQDGRVQLWDSSGQRQLTPTWLAHPHHAVRNISFSPDNQRLLTSGDDQITYMWDISKRTTPKLLTKWAGITSAIFSPDGEHIVTIRSAGFGAGLVLLNLEGKTLAEWRAHNTTRSLTFSPQGERIATSGDDFIASVRLWDLSGNEMLRFAPSDPKHPRIEQVSFSPDGQLLATAGIDGTAQLWTLSGLKFAQFAPYGVNGGPWFRSVSFSSDGKYLITADADGKVKFWKIEGLDDLLNRGCAWLKDYLVSHPEEAANICPS